MNNRNPGNFGINRISLPKLHLNGPTFMKPPFFSSSRGKSEGNRLTQELLLLDLKRAYSCTTAYSDSIAVFYLNRFSFKRRRSSLCNGGAALDNFPFLPIRH